MKILILGGTGVISREIVKQGLEQGHEIMVFNRGNHREEMLEGIEVILGDRTRADEFAEKMKAVDADVVIDMICFNEQAARQTVEVFGNRVSQIIVTSSIAAYDRPYQSYPIREAKETLTEKPDFAYGFNKAEAERYLQGMMGKQKAAITIIRPSLTFGPGAANFGILRQNRNVARRIREGKPVVMIGEGVIPWSFTFVQDLARGFVLSCGNEKTYNDYFHVTNTEIVMWEDLYRAVGKAVGKEPKMVYIPTVLLREMLPSVCEHLNFEKVHFSVFCMDKFKAAAPEYEPKIGLEAGIKELLEWWEKIDFPYDEEKDHLEDEICRCYEEFREHLLKLV